MLTVSLVESVECRLRKRESGLPIYLDLDESARYFRNVLGESPDVTLREFRTGADRGLRVLLVYIETLVDTDAIAEHVVEKLLAPYPYPITATNAVRLARERLLAGTRLRRIDHYEDAVDHLLRGYALLLFEGNREALAFDAGREVTRAIGEPETERVARGPREGFNESVKENIALLRRKLRTPNLRLETFPGGRYTENRITLAYIQGIASPGLIDEVRSRLRRIDGNVDGILLSQTVAELIEDHPFSLVPTVNATERPDRVAAALLEGRFAIFVDGTPFVLVSPTLLADYMVTTEDYTSQFYVATFTRILRYIALFGTLFLPAIYVALVSFHQEMIPTALLLSIAAGRENVPFPAFAEAMLMELTFEVLREAGLRLPGNIGSAISIVGVLVVGQAAVDAGIVSPLMIIVVGATAIASFAIPSYIFADTVRVLRFPILLLAGSFGFVGIVVSFILLSLHVASLRSFGIPFSAPLTPFHASDMKDTIVRVPAWGMRFRTILMSMVNPRRLAEEMMPTPEGSARGDGN